MTEADTRTIAVNLVIEVVRALSGESELEADRRLSSIAQGLRGAAGEFASGEASEFMLALADGIEPL